MTTEEKRARMRELAEAMLRKNTDETRVIINTLFALMKSQELAFKTKLQCGAVVSLLTAIAAPDDVVEDVFVEKATKPCEA